VSADWNEIICIDGWAPDESAYDDGYYPEGTRAKAVYFSPDDVGDSPLRPNWRYLFKQSRSWAPWQFWMEIIAYRIGQVMGVRVPHAYAGVSHTEQPGQPIYGALIEWFYPEDAKYVEGANLLGPFMPDFDYKTGKPHNLKSILSVLPHANRDDEDIRRFWANVLTFDTVIGNVDRHPANWGFTFTKPEQHPDGSLHLEFKVAPAFDNGTALSWEQSEENFAKFDDKNYLNRYLTRPQKARHHMSWSLDTLDENINFFDFMRRFVSEYPETKESIISKLQFTENDIRERIGPLADIPNAADSGLTENRIEFTLKMVMERTALLRETLK
jgi:hypothetical protein